VQGRLRKEPLTVDVSTSCAHCSQTLELTIDSDLNVTVHQDTDPLVFIPEVSLFEVEDPSIIDSF